MSRRKPAHSYSEACMRAHMLRIGGNGYAVIAEDLATGRYANPRDESVWHYWAVVDAIIDSGLDLPTGDLALPPERVKARRGKVKPVVQSPPNPPKRMTQPGTLRWEDVPAEIRDDIKADIVAHLLRAAGYTNG